MQNTVTLVVVVLVVLLALALFGAAGMMGGFGIGPGMMGGGMMGGYGSQFGFGYNPLAAILSLLFWALIIGGVALLVVWLARSGKFSTAASGSQSPLGIAKARYAHGEINKEQFDALKRDLEA